MCVIPFSTQHPLRPTTTTTTTTTAAAATTTPTPGRVDQQAGSAAEVLGQLTQVVERKRNTLKSLLRRELQVLEFDEVNNFLSSKKKKSAGGGAASGKRGGGGLGGVGGGGGGGGGGGPGGGRRGLTKDEEAQMAARLFARSQAVSMLLNRSTLASTHDEGTRDDNLLRIMISECFGALCQVMINERAKGAKNRAKRVAAVAAICCYCWLG